VSVLAAVLVVLGSTLYLTVRQQLLSSVDDGVRLVAERASEQWLNRDTVDAAGLSTGPYTVNWTDNPELVNVTRQNGQIHYDPASMRAAIAHGSDLRSSGTS